MGGKSASGNGKSLLGEGSMMGDEKPKGPLKEMLRREEMERVERLRVGRGAA